ncbi:hypothetical protein GS636_08550 [Ruegeria sp. HKCCD4884]|uniref:hypothetical protein n=1 Tax=Ruegeria sp. HKCCD4884 TaxID=2683022 RepID=UPI001490EB7A|nr:hypothetical protein [Ruegeria sp. HKCCD4884]NOD92832.1 hypothetical protein [Ruegeria sp. HKCCD4884]
MKYLWFHLFIATTLALTACGEIQDHSKIRTTSKSINGEYIAGVGDTVLTIENTESLPNAFGAADILGRTRPTGTTTVYFNGYSNGKAQFVRRDVLIHSSKTTVNSTPLIVNPSSQSTFSGNIGGIPYYGSSSTSTYPIIVPPNTPQDQVAGIRDINIAPKLVIKFS